MTGRKSLYAPPRTTRTKTVTCRAIGRFTVELEGPGVFDVLADLVIPKMRPVGGGNVWWIPQARAEDAIACLEHRGFRVEVTF